MRTVAVIGSGTMGSGIAQVCAQTGWETRLYDAFPESLDKGMNSIDEFWKSGIRRGKNTEEQVKDWSEKLVPCGNLEDALSGVDLVILRFSSCPRASKQLSYIRHISSLVCLGKKMVMRLSIGFEMCTMAAEATVVDWEGVDNKSQSAMKFL